MELEESQSSVFLSYLPSLIAHGAGNRILQCIVAGHGGPQSILNLRKVHSKTKEWIDTLHFPTMTDRIFYNIPFTFTLNANDFEKFKKCPPPPAATSMILQIPATDGWYESDEDDEVSPDVNSDVYKEFLKFISLKKETFPEFFAFWTHRLQCLKTSSYKEALLTLGSPKPLRYLDCLIIQEPCSTLCNLKTLKVRRLCFSKDVTSETEVEFYKQLANSRSLTRLEIEIYEDNIESRREKITNTNTNAYHDVLKGLQLLIDIKRNDRNFRLHVAFQYEWPHPNIIAIRASNEDLRSFVSSVVSSASKIRIFKVDDKDIQKVVSTCDRKAAKEFFQFVRSTEANFGHDEDEIPFQYLGEFSNIETTSMTFKSQDELLVKLPSSIRTLEVETELAHLNCSWPEHLRNLTLDAWNWSDPASLIEIFETLSKNCRKLETLHVETITLDPTQWNGLPLWETESESSHDRFLNLRELIVQIRFENGHPLGTMLIESDPSMKTPPRNLLQRVCRVREIPSLRKFELYCDLANKGVPKILDSDYVASLLDSPLKQTLVTTNISMWFTKDAKEKFGPELFYSLKENKKLHDERYGREETGLKFFK